MNHLYDTQQGRNRKGRVGIYTAPYDGGEDVLRAQYTKPNGLLKHGDNGTWRYYYEETR